MSDFSIPIIVKSRAGLDASDASAPASAPSLEGQPMAQYSANADIATLYEPPEGDLNVFSPSAPPAFAMNSRAGQPELIPMHPPSYQEVVEEKHTHAVKSTAFSSTSNSSNTSSSLPLVFANQVVYTDKESFPCCSCPAVCPPSCHHEVFERRANGDLLHHPAFAQNGPGFLWGVTPISALWFCFPTFMLCCFHYSRLRMRRLRDQSRIRLQLDWLHSVGFCCSADRYVVGSNIDRADITLEVPSEGVKTSTALFTRKKTYKIKVNLQLTLTTDRCRFVLESKSVDVECDAEGNLSRSQSAIIATQAPPTWQHVIATLNAERDEVHHQLCAASSVTAAAAPPPAQMRI